MKYSLDYFKAHGSDIRMHGNGFIQFDMEHPLDDPYRHDTLFPETHRKSRIHVWSPDLHECAQQDNEEDKITRTPIHNHKFSFQSEILFGKLQHIIYKIVTGFDYNPYHAKPQKDENTILMPTWDWCSAEVTGMGLFTTGEQYRFESRLFHTSIASAPSMTELTKTYEGYIYPRVLCRKGYTPDNEWNRYSMDPDLLWEAVEDIMKHDT